MLQFLLQFLSCPSVFSFQRWTTTEETEILCRNRALYLGRISNFLVAFCSFVFRSWDRLLEEFPRNQRDAKIWNGEAWFLEKETNTQISVNWRTLMVFVSRYQKSVLSFELHSINKKIAQWEDQVQDISWSKSEPKVESVEMISFKLQILQKKGGRIEICSFLTEISSAQIKYLLYGRSNWCNIACFCGERGGRRFYHASGVPWSKSGTVGPFVVRKLHH